MGKIHIAARDGDLETVQECIEKGSSIFSGPDSVDVPLKNYFSNDVGIAEGDTPIVCAIKHDRKEVVAYLHGKKALLPKGVFARAFMSYYWRLGRSSTKESNNPAGLELLNYFVDQMNPDPQDIQLIMSDAFLYEMMSLVEFLCVKKKLKLEPVDAGSCLANVIKNSMAGSNTENIIKILIAMEPKIDLSIVENLIETASNNLYDQNKANIKEYVGIIKWLIKLYFNENRLELKNLSKIKTGKAEIYDFVIDLLNTPNKQKLFHEFIREAVGAGDQLFMERCLFKKISPFKIHTEIIITRSGSQLSSFSSSEHGAMLTAVAKARLDLIKWMVAQGEDVDFSTDEGASLIDLAKATKNIGQNAWANWAAFDNTITYISERQKIKQKDLERKEALASLRASTPAISQADTFTWEAIALMDKIYEDPSAMKRYTQLLEQVLLDKPNFVPALLALRAITCNLAHRNQLENQIIKSKSFAETENWFKQKMHLHPGASYLFGNFLDLNDVRLDETTVLYQTAADKNIVQGKFALGTVEKDPQKKLAFYTQAANAGFKVAAFWAARAYIYEEGVNKDVERGILLAKEALDAGIHSAYLLLGHAYHYEQKDYKEGLKMYHLSIAACEEDFKKYGGDKDSDVVCDKIRAQLSIARCYWQGADDIFGADSHLKARDWARKVTTETSPSYLKDAYEAAEKIVAKADKHTDTLHKSASMHSQYNNTNSGNPKFTIPDGIKDRSVRPTVYGKQ